MRLASPSCGGGDGSTSAPQRVGPGARGGKKLARTRPIAAAGSKHHIATDARGVPLVAHVTAANVNDITHLDALAADGRPDGPTSCMATVATIRNHIMIASPPAALLRSSAVARRHTAAALAFSAGSSSARSSGFIGRERHDRVHHVFLTLVCALICWNYLKSTGRVL